MKKTGDQLDIIVKILILIGMFIAVVLVPEILDVGNALAKQTPWAMYVAAAVFLAVYIGIACLGWWIIKPNLSRPQFTKFTWPEIKMVLIGYGLICILSMGLNALMNLVYGSAMTQNQTNVNDLLSTNTITLIVFSFAGAFIAPFVEEFIFRGIVISYFFKHQAWWLSVILSGILFSLGHASNNLISFSLYATMGMILAYLFKKSGQIKVSIALHMLNNTIAMILTIMTLVSAK
ncbi:CPBP family intramembrane glutamic endopeptidase [Periweissella ghanensis]|uniref:CAAX prenyl protease 2/Lysostaphin resistance protein A-like domain-containing protein n=1 Tax=Periweissella ghanensis TaxID=467997 RepID=A0ABN8BQ67_9LACO|nr:type II CAAX endopeptidase family protein [Periweissella ghanensis]MCM0601789.1 CPBP family intramembrane metalloprotease [Periweissella ghanensis]CAH0418776.1 hypothetical protein WGH24286_01211 [Periweissella ghanensis]